MLGDRVVGIRMFAPGMPVAMLEPPTVITRPVGIGGAVLTFGILSLMEERFRALVENGPDLSAFARLGAAMEIFIISSTMAAIMVGLIMLVPPWPHESGPEPSQFQPARVRCPTP